MKNRIIISVLGLTIIIVEPLAIGQANSPQKKADKEYVEAANSRPALSAKYGDVAAVKVASRKSTYHLGEMITVDVALLNTADSMVYFHKLEFPSVQLQARDDQGKEVRIFLNSTILEGITAESYSLVPSGGVLVKSFLIAAQCSNKDRAAHIQARQKLEEDEREGRAEYQKGLFERNLFVNWGEGCLNISRPGTYFLSAELANDHVLISHIRPRPKTAVGMTRSIPLTITVE